MAGAIEVRIPVKYIMENFSAAARQYQDLIARGYVERVDSGDVVLTLAESRGR